MNLDGTREAYREQPKMGESKREKSEESSIEANDDEPDTQKVIPEVNKVALETERRQRLEKAEERLADTWFSKGDRDSSLNEKLQTIDDEYQERREKRETTEDGRVTTRLQKSINKLVSRWLYGWKEIEENRKED